MPESCRGRSHARDVGTKHFDSRYGFLRTLIYAKGAYRLETTPYGNRKQRDDSLPYFGTDIDGRIDTV